MRSNSRYTTVAIGLHWLMALLVLGLLTLGIYMADLPLSPWKLQLYSWHKWVGVTVFLLAIVRLSWRYTHRPPVLPDNTSKRLRLAAHAVHYCLYALMLAVPVSGWLMSSAKGFQTVYFGVLPIPDLLSKDKALGTVLETVHQTLNFTFIGLLIAHLAAALKHHFIDKDALLSRMSFRRPS
ncbi:cytochrome b [Methylomonas albis]|uniref:Cytochrome b n=1 Tax=Methylomonas albis TaxID=1854563 RepID=A0ABR9D5A6_9GAMM|nr:cytochrome b [Methylomonas albis]MBD9358307.1 cytochrome b [Methylomonas albis]